ncbi:Tat pathway signal protein [Altererythrobacter sp. B11]|uniref:Acg family FMN-binding oxidoreductase n=1 Tax=Altererythrobacter sp. B11 TaxID=2060312 RepID=UPI000DC7159C|nr:Tat pathway signal protein [Altererythrobacter sp. B11]BBC72322.1 Tat pathway signal protein [Altererythrobacter sp. B11]
MPNPDPRDSSLLPAGLTRRNVLIGGGAVLGLAAAAGGAGFVQMGSMADYSARMSNQRAPLRASGGLVELVRYATLAPNGHNTQPWRFTLDQGSIAIAPDFTRRTPVVDPDDHHLFVSLGCAAENLALAAAACGLPGELRFDRGRLIYDYGRGEPRRSALYDAIPRRQSTRAPFAGGAVPPEHLAVLEQAAAEEGVHLRLLTDRPAIAAARDLVIAANTRQMGDAAFRRELVHWLRFSPRAALADGDGIPSVVSGNPPLPEWVGHAIFPLVFTTEGENDRYARLMDSASGLAVFSGERADPEHWARVGRACQRFALQATALGMKLSFVNQPVEVAAFRSDLAALAGMGRMRPDLLLRFGYGDPMPMTPRRPVAAVIEA